MEEIYQILQCLHKVSKKGKQDVVITVLSFSRAGLSLCYPTSTKTGPCKNTFFLRKNQTKQSAEIDHTLQKLIFHHHERHYYPNHVRIRI